VPFSQSLSCASPEIFNNFPARISARGARHAASWVCSGAAEIETFDWSSVLSPAKDGAKGEELIE